MQILQSNLENENPIALGLSELALPALGADLENEKLDPQTEIDNGGHAFQDEQSDYGADLRGELDTNDNGEETTVDPDSADAVQDVPWSDEDGDDDDNGGDDGSTADEDGG